MSRKLETTRLALIAQADHQNKQHHQYRGHWKDWKVGRILRNVKTKLGLAFQKGDLVLVSPETRAGYGPETKHKTFYTAYSWRNGIDTSIESNRVELQ